MYYTRLIFHETVKADYVLQFVFVDDSFKFSRISMQLIYSRMQKYWKQCFILKSPYTVPVLLLSVPYFSMFKKNRAWRSFDLYIDRNQEDKRKNALKQMALVYWFSLIAPFEIIALIIKCSYNFYIAAVMIRL